MPLPPPCLQATRHPRCRIRVTVIDAPRDPPQRERKVVLGAVMVTNY